MRRLLIDTDTGGDDAVALIMALRDPGVRVEAVTTVMGNVEVEQATQNALLAIERAGTYAPPVYRGLHNAVLNEPLVTSTGGTAWAIWACRPPPCAPSRSTRWIF